MGYTDIVFIINKNGEVIVLKVSVLYPRSSDSHFDIEYYRDSHMPMVKNYLGDVCIRTEVEEGISAEQPFHAMGHVYFDSMDSFQTHYPAHAEKIRSDIQNYTNITPVVQMSLV